MTRELEIAVASCAYGGKGSSFDFEAGAKWADIHPKSPWINVKEDLPCNHDGLIVKKGLMTMTKRVIVVEGDSLYFDRMLLENNEWDWVKSICPSHWFAIPELPKE